MGTISVVSLISLPVPSATAVISASSESSFGAELTALSSTSATTSSTTKTKKTKATKSKIIHAGDSGVPTSASLVLAGASALPPASLSREKPQYKTVYVTKTAQPESGAGSPDLPPGAIAGVAVGGAIFLALIVGLVYLILRRRRKKVIESTEVPRSSGSQITFVAEKDRTDTMVSELHGRDRQVYEASGKVVYEMDASMPELDGSRHELDDRSFSLGSEQSRPMTPTMLAARNIMSRGRPVRRDKG